MLKIYGSPRSSAGRCYLVLEEVGAQYETVSLDMMEKKEHKAPAYLKLNPNGKIPTLVDGDFVIWESMAINHYLAAKYKPELLGKGLQESSLVQQWSFWAISEFQPPMVEILIQLFFVPEDKRNHQLIKKCEETLPGYFEVLNNSLKGKSFLVGKDCTLADLNIASVVNMGLGLKLELTQYPAIQTWFSMMKARPSFQKYAEMRTPKK